MRTFGWTMLTAVLVALLVVLTVRPLSNDSGQPLVAPSPAIPATPAPVNANPSVTPAPASASASATPLTPPSAVPSSPVGGTPAGDDRVIVTRVRPTSGPLRGGNEVRIRGRNLDLVSEVRFGDRKARVLEASPQLLIVVAPAGTSIDPVNIVLTHPKGGVEAASYRYRR